MSQSAALRLRLVILGLMCIPALTAGGCNCGSRDGSDDNQGLPSPGTLQFSAAAMSVSEYIGTVTVQVNRAGGSLGAVDVTYSTSGGTATAGTDYTAANGTLSWADGVTTAQTFPITITDDLLADNAETIVVSLTNPTGGATVGGSLTITLIDIWTKFPGNPVLGPSAGSWDDGGVLGPSVVQLGPNSYEIFYQAGGTNFNDSIGRATSTDGITWTKTGTLPVFTPVRPNGAGLLTAGTFDDDAILRPCVVYDLSAPVNERYRMWYTGFDLIDDGMGGLALNAVGIGRATSPDGITWTPMNPRNPVLTNGPAGRFDEVAVAFASVINDAGNLKMWYTGFNTTGPSAIGYATSTTGGASWTPNATAVYTGGGAAFEVSGPSDPWVIKDGVFYRMFYTGERPDATAGQVVWNVGYARSPDGITGWAPFAGNPALTPSTSGWDSTDVFFPCLLRDGTSLKVWYTGTSGNGATGRDGLATNP